MYFDIFFMLGDNNLCTFSTFATQTAGMFKIKTLFRTIFDFDKIP